ncbi:hypothetical protein N184_02280 [Sinorhizobium sp. GL28]|nr:hypothetical protein N183_01225 [Sinorhizobium sp. Sb3]KSV95804.1 hypothetical protein N184_02280 [Sinorhizobium sp. GL28]
MQPESDRTGRQIAALRSKAKEYPFLVSIHFAMSCTAILSDSLEPHAAREGQRTGSDIFDAEIPVGLIPKHFRARHHGIGRQ